MHLRKDKNQCTFKCKTFDNAINADRECPSNNVIMQAKALKLYDKQLPNQT